MLEILIQLLPLPTRDELMMAGKWCITHDVSEAFAEELNKLLVALGIDDANT